MFMYSTADEAALAQRLSGPIEEAVRRPRRRRQATTFRPGRRGDQL
jgi:hypothetical protein